jgi:hypothetical protein
MTHERQKISRFDLSCSMDVLFEGLWISTVNWNFYPTKYKFFSSCNFYFIFGIRIGQKCWIRIRICIEPMRIHKTVLRYRYRTFLSKSHVLEFSYHGLLQKQLRHLPVLYIFHICVWIASFTLFGLDLQQEAGPQS